MMSNAGHRDAASERISDALAEIGEASQRQTDGKWLERLTADCAPLIAEWDVDRAWLWRDWPDRETHYPATPDIGVDVVAKRRSDGRLVAIQCKSRKLDGQGRGADIAKKEFDSFLAASADDRWAERWLVVNGAVQLSGNAGKTVGQKPVTLVNVEADLRKQQEIGGPRHDGAAGGSSRDRMQEKVIRTNVESLQAQASTNGRSRGRIISALRHGQVPHRAAYRRGAHGTGTGLGRALPLDRARFAAATVVLGLLCHAPRASCRTVRTDVISADFGVEAGFGVALWYLGFASHKRPRRQPR